LFALAALNLIRSLEPAIVAALDQMDRGRGVPEELARLMAEAGLFRLRFPRG
jgi:hypothetical protein